LVVTRWIVLGAFNYGIASGAHEQIFLSGSFFFFCETLVPCSVSFSTT